MVSACATRDAAAAGVRTLGTRASTFASADDVCEPDMPSFSGMEKGRGSGGGRSETGEKPKTLLSD